VRRIGCRLILLLMASSSGDLDVQAKIGKIDADIELAKAKLSKAESERKENLIVSYNSRLNSLEAQLIELLKLLPKPGIVCPICSHSLLFLY